MASAIFPTPNFAQFERYVITGIPGFYVLTSLINSANVLQFENHTLPTRYIPGGQAEWDEIIINFGNCDWVLSFGAPNNNLPSPGQISAYIETLFVPLPGTMGVLAVLPSVAAGESLVNTADSTPSIVYLKNLVAGTGIGLSHNNSQITIDSTGTLMRNSTLRANVDPTGSVGPTGGLLLPPGTGQFQMPLTVVDVGLGIGSAYFINDNGDFTMNADNILFNNEGHFYILVQAFSLGTVDKVDPFIAQVLLDGQAIFAATPASTGGTQESLTVPFGPTYTKAWSASGGANAFITAGQQLALVILPSNPADFNELTRTCSISITRVDAEGFIGPPGIPGVIQTVNNIGGGLALVDNPGGNANIDIKTLIAGTDITLTDNGNDITIDATPNPNNIRINFQVTDVDTGSGNEIAEIGNGQGTALISCSDGPPAIQVSVPSGVLQLNLGSFELLGISSAVGDSMLAYDTVSKMVSYTALTAGTGLSYVAPTLSVDNTVMRRIDSSNNAVNVALAGTGDFQSFAIAAAPISNVFTTPGESLMATWMFDTNTGSGNVAIEFAGTSATLVGTVTGVLQCWVTLTSNAIPAANLFTVAVSCGSIQKVFFMSLASTGGAYTLKTKVTVATAAITCLNAVLYKV